MLIVENYKKLSNISNIWLAFRSDAFFANLSPYYRPMMNVSFIIDTILGQGNIAVYHFSNLVYHILTGFLLYRFLQLLRINIQVSLFATILFLIHPVMGHAILWIPARGDLLVTMFALISGIWLIKSIDTGKWFYIVIHLIGFTAAIFSKESAVMLPLIYLLIIYSIHSKLLKPKYLTFPIGWIMITLFWYYLRSITIDNRPDDQRGLGAILNNLPFIPEAFARLLLPVGLPVTPVFTTLITTFGIALIIAIGYLFYKFRRKADIGLTLLGLIWFLAFCTPNMFVRLASANDNYEYLLHRLYLPSVGLLIFFLGLIPESTDLWSSSTRKRIILSILSLLVIVDFFQQPQYKNATTFWTSSIKYAPGRSWFYYYYGRYYFRQKDFDNYEKYLLKADSIQSYPNFHYQLAMIYFTERKDYNKAFRYFQSAFSQKGFGDEEARRNFVLFCIESSGDFALKGLLDEAIARCSLALDNDPENPVAAYNLGLYVIGKGQKERAVSLWKQALKYRNDFADPCKSLAIYYFFDRQMPDSAQFYSEKYNELGGKENLATILIHR
jgi:tetratricopeptide (TPR) repeat protein